MARMDTSCVDWGPVRGNLADASAQTVVELQLHRSVPLLVLVPAFQTRRPGLAPSGRLFSIYPRAAHATAAGQANDRSQPEHRAWTIGAAGRPDQAAENGQDQEPKDCTLEKGR